MRSIHRRYTQLLTFTFPVLIYIVQLPDSFADEYRKLHDGEGPSSDVVTHLNQDLTHKIWSEHMLTPCLKTAYEHGHVVKCADGVERRFFP